MKISKSNCVSMAMVADVESGVGVSITVASGEDTRPDVLFQALSETVDSVKRIHLEKLGRTCCPPDVAKNEQIGELIYNGYPVSYWHALAVHYRGLAINIERLTETAIDSEPSPNGLAGE